MAWRRRGILGACCLALLAGGALPARADLVNFDLAGRLYTKYLYRNNDRQGLVSYGNPFWTDNISGDNGVGTEFELKVFGRVSKYVSAYARLQSRFGELWQDWWENGDFNPAGANTSGESLGMNHASYIKLRGTWVRLQIPTPSWWTHTLTWGSSDLGMFNPWTIGKVRYIDRDNGKGIFLNGIVKQGLVSYDLAMIAMPKLWVGPWWSTGIGDPMLSNPFWSRDWAYAAKLAVAPDWGSFTLISTLTNDVEVDRTDPDAVGSAYATCKDDLGNPIVGCQKDHAVDTFSRFWNSVTTLEVQADPLSWLSLNGLVVLSMQGIDPKLTANGVQLNQGVSPVVFRSTYGDAFRSADDWAFRLRGEFQTAFGLAVKVEYFHIGQHVNAIFGSRREADVLLTEGFIEGGQLPTLNLANEFIDFDEAFVESCIGWHGATVVPSYAASFAGGTVEVSGEGTVLTYNQNAQNRDVDRVYPDFLHSDGFTDTDLYDYANTTDRGRDPRSVFRRNQDRLTGIGVLHLRTIFDAYKGVELGLKGKYLWDRDWRSHLTAQDDYLGQQVQVRARLAMGLADGLRGEVGVQYDHWWEKGRKGTLLTDETGRRALSVIGYNDDRTRKWKAHVGLTYEYEGLKLGYRLEFLDKYQWRRPVDENQHWLVVRSKATMEVAW
ncbi:hypothetical protein KBD49_08625 [Myxococcota bacterium]|nr:hypothetical protein [Myxococcota bacterium]